ncbi:unnamed protein product, partial [Ectocarpus sp. 12 AP-2014]
MSLCIYASELSACVGMNKYKSVEDAKMGVWRRWDTPSFREASERNLIAPHKTDEEMFASTTPSVQKLVSTAVSSETEKAATKIVERVIENVRVKDLKEVSDSVVTVVNCRRGTQNEHKGIASYENATRVKLHGKNLKFYKKCIGETSAGTKVCVGGRVDGLTNDKVVEVKSRRSRLFKTLPIYEKVQVQAYMFLTDKPVAEVVQKYDGMMRSDEHVADTEFWDAV